MVDGILKPFSNIQVYKDSGQGLANFSCKEPANKYFSFNRLHSLTQLCSSTVDSSKAAVAAADNVEMSGHGHVQYHWGGWEGLAPKSNLLTSAEGVRRLGRFPAGHLCELQFMSACPLIICDVMVMTMMVPVF